LKQPTYSLQSAVGEFLTDRRHDLEQTTWLTYRSHLGAFVNWLPAKQRILASVEPSTLRRYIHETTANRNTAMNKAIAFRAFGTYLAKDRLWFAGTNDAPLSVVRDLDLPHPSPKGQAPYRDDEVQQILNAVAQGPNALRNQAVIYTELHGFRGKETRMMLLANVRMPHHNELLGEFAIDEESATKRRSNGVRTVPMSKEAREVITRYLRRGRPEFRGPDAEPLFITDDGEPFTEDGWNSMAQRFRVLCREAGIPFRQHRFRSTAAKNLHEQGVPDSAIMELLGWSSMAMLRRYLGKIPVARLKQYPTPLDRMRLRAVV
jgi:integrase